MEPAARPYPAHWEADVVLRDGGTAHLRPIRPDDADRLVRFHSRLSEQTIYFRFFAPYPKLTQRDVERFTVVDFHDRVAIIALVGTEMIGVVRYDKIIATEAEVAFNIEDAHQGRGLGSVLLEHIAQAARENGVERFVAEVLPTNRKMIAVFKEAGYSPSHEYEDGVLRMEFAIEPTAESMAVMVAREHRAEAISIDRLLRPSSIAVVGAGRLRRSAGHQIVTNLHRGGFAGAVFAVNTRAAVKIAGVASYRSLEEIPDPVDLVVVAVPAEAVDEVVAQAGAKGVHGLLVTSAGFADAGSKEGRGRQVELVRAARRHGMRVIGPMSFGLINTDPELRLNASIVPAMPRRGRVAFFSQSGELGLAVLGALERRGLGVSTFVSAGNRADVSGNDLLQYWEEDPDTAVVLMYLESSGNPRKFSRIARRVGRSKPVVLVRAGRMTSGVPLGHDIRTSSAPQAAVDALFDQSGVLRVADTHQALDVAAVLTLQPLPEGRRVAVVGNSSALALLAFTACVEEGLEVVGQPYTVPYHATLEDYGKVIDEAVGAAGADAVVAVMSPQVDVAQGEVAALIDRAAHTSGRPTVATFLGLHGGPEFRAARSRRRAEDGSADPLADGSRTFDVRLPVPDRVIGSVPVYPTPEDAVRALALVARYAEWRRSPVGELPDLDGIDEDSARALVEGWLAKDRGGRGLSGQEARDLLRCFGVTVWPARPVSTAREAVEAAQRLGFPVTLKTTAPHLRHRADLGGVALGLPDARAVRTAFADLSTRFGADVARTLVVQRMAPPGVAVVVGSMEDPLVGPIVSFGVAGVATDLLGDLAFRIPPLTDVDARTMIRSVRAAPLLFGHRGAQPVDVAALEQLVLRVSRLADEFPEVASLTLNPVLVSASGVAPLDVELRLAPPVGRIDQGVRRLGGW